ncbi:DoxX family protein [Actinoplanes sp. NPDC049681]|uniref:DoxX family protein n=1 Tax=Actinoplanes sp. NPDC049681 TaxID=3363905 RepID=UPI0037AD6FEC
MILILLSLLLAALFLIAGGVKVAGLRPSLRIRDHLGMTPTAWRTIGLLEAAGAVGLLAGLGVSVLGLLAAIGLAVLMLGAIGTRIKVGDPARLILLDGAVLVLAGVAAALQVAR